MDWQTLNFALDYLTSTGTTFSVEQRVSIQTSLRLLQHENQFSRMQFWGRILGTENDYYIVCGIGKDYLKDRVFFYSINTGLQWILLPPPTPLTMELGLAARGRFIGDPTADSETECTENDKDEIEEGEQWAFIKEEERLSATVAGITSDSTIAPRGALTKLPNGLVVQNKLFTGLKMEEASQMTSYYHMRRPINAWDKNIVLRADYNITLDFLDSIAVDQPLGCWGIQIDKLETISTIRSLYWPGSVAYHVLETPQYGWMYTGTGKKNWDVPFMILPPPPVARASVLEDYLLNAEDGEGDGHFLAFAKQAYMKPGVTTGTTPTPFNNLGSSIQNDRV